MKYDEYISFIKNYYKLNNIEEFKYKIIDYLDILNGKKKINKDIEEKIKDIPEEFLFYHLDLEEISKYLDKNSELNDYTLKLFLNQSYYDSEFAETVFYPKYAPFLKLEDIIKNITNIKFYLLFEYKTFSEKELEQIIETVEKLKENDIKKDFWFELSASRNINENIIERHQDKIVWEIINCDKLSPEFFIKHADKPWFWGNVVGSLRKRFFKTDFENYVLKIIKKMKQLGEKESLTDFVISFIDEISEKNIFLKENTNKRFVIEKEELLEKSLKYFEIRNNWNNNYYIISMLDVFITSINSIDQFEKLMSKINLEIIKKIKNEKIYIQSDFSNIDTVNFSKKIKIKIKKLFNSKNIKDYLKNKFNLYEKKIKNNPELLKKIILNDIINLNIKVKEFCNLNILSFFEEKKFNNIKTKEKDNF